MNLDVNKIDNLDFDIDLSDYPDLCDSYIISGDYEGREMTDDELDWLHDNCPTWVHEKILESLH